jgi:hypothetical protein
MRIGLDFGYTLVDYDTVFSGVAREGAAHRDVHRNDWEGVSAAVFGDAG